MPRGVFNFLPGPGPVVGAAVVGHPGVDAALAFIGSIATGQEVARRAAGKAQILELGGNLERGLAFAESARAGWVNVNASTNYWESHLPFGGRSGSASGRGRVGGRAVLDAFTEPKRVILPAPRLLGRNSSFDRQ